jgi:PAS domain-containing protein
MDSETIGILFENVADRRLAEQAQLEGQARKSAILDSALDAIVTFDHEGESSNGTARPKHFRSSTGASPGTGTGRGGLPAGDKAPISGVPRQVPRTGKSDLLGRRVELTGHRSDGRLVPAGDERQPRADGRLTDPHWFFAGHHRAQTVRRSALRRSEEHFRSLIENSSDVIAIVKEQGRFAYVSHTVQRILSYRPED